MFTSGVTTRTGVRSFPHTLRVAVCALALAAPAAARAEAPADIAALRQEIAAIRAAYDARLQALEQRLAAADASPPPPQAAAAAAAAAAVAAATAPPPAAAPGSGANAFNPALSLVLSGLYARTSRDPSRYAIDGFALPPGAEAGPGTRGLSLAETELGFAANIDPWLRGVASIALHADDTLSVEEAYVQTTALGGGWSARAGRFLSGVGYLNAQHAHAWDFVDSPLAYQAMLGTQYGDDGVQLSWLAPVDRYVELGFELGRGRSFPGGDDSRNGAGMAAFSAHTGGDLGDSHSWRAGLSVLGAKAADQALTARDAAGSSTDGRFAGRTRVWIADAVWKWAPDGNATRTSFKLQGEVLRSTRSGTLDLGLGADRYRAEQSGWYLQGVWQFMPRWRLGLRTERLDAGADTPLWAAAGANPRKNTLMVDFSPSEFSRVRLQFGRDRASAGAPDNQFFLQYQTSLGAHGAHGY